MEDDFQRGKRKRVYSVEPLATLRATFSQNYLNYLLPAMLKLGSFESFNADEGQEKYKLVKDQVDMALAVSARGFIWSHALKQKLKINMNVETLHKSTRSSLLPVHKHNFSVFGEKQLQLLSPISMPPAIPRPFFLSVSHKTCYPAPSSQNSAIISKSTCRKNRRKRARERDEDEELGRRLATLRRILPGGNDMEVSKLFTEVKSYVVCLELQVHILRTLVDTQSAVLM
ncbi:transcription factor bHLH146-like [Aristolochia californica]|uniref:transcription factor bHLH146-like n=1 Tax=Aristolochia californica TaxID=171875 RepID=UPI0035D85EE5